MGTIFYKGRDDKAKSHLFGPDHNARKQENEIMRKLYMVLCLLAFLTVNAKGEEDADGANISSDTVLKAIAQVELDPIKAKSNGTFSIIISFAAKSPDVLVTVNTEYLPWLNQEKKIDNTDILLCAFIAGNMRPQLAQKKKKDHPVDGIKFMLSVYNRLRKDEKIESIVELDKWSKLDDKELNQLCQKTEKDSEQKNSSDKK